MSIKGLVYWLTTPPDEGEEAFFERDVEEENLDIAHELGACGGDCPRCQQERAERREEREADGYGEDFM